MRLTIPRIDLASLVARGCSIAPKTAIAPIVRHARLVLKGGTLSISTTDLEHIVEASTACTMDKPGATTVDAERFSAAVSKFKGDEVSISLEDRDLIVKCGRSRLRFATLPVEDFPSWDWSADGARFELAGAELARLLTHPAAAAAMGASGNNLHSVFLHCRSFGGDDVLASVGTNGHIVLLAALSAPDGASVMPDNGGRPGAILSLETTGAALRLFRGEKAVAVEVSRNRVVFTGETTRLAAKLVEGIYPGYERIIPLPQETRILVDRTRCLDSIALLDTFNTKDAGHKLECAANDDGFILATGSGDGEGVDIADAEVTGRVQPFGISSLYLRTVLGAFKSETVTISYEEPSRPVLFLSDAETDLTAVVGTMRITTNRVSEPAHD